MRARGVRGGILLSPETDDTLETVEASLAEQRDLLSGHVSLELPARLPAAILDAVRTAVAAAGGTFVDVRPTGPTASAKGENLILGRTVRSGGRVESTGSVVVLGDVNAGAEILAADAIIVLGTLRGLAHAGAAGNENAFIWAQEIRSPQLRIGAALAQTDVDEVRAEGPEVAHLQDGQIVVRPWDP